jgi:hypothetical protein
VKLYASMPVHSHAVQCAYPLALFGMLQISSTVCWAVESSILVHLIPLLVVNPVYLWYVDFKSLRAEIVHQLLIG